MQRFISKYIIDSDADPKNAEIRQRCGARTGAIGIALNLTLATVKCLLGFFLGSIAVVADGLNNLSDTGASVVTLAGFHLAGRKADHEHPFGHGRMEYLAGFLVALVIILMGIEIGKASLIRLFMPQSVAFSWLTISMLVFSIVVKMWMFCFYRSVGARIASTTMDAAATDSLFDSIATAVVLASILIEGISGIQIDAFAGLVVALFILKGGWDAVKDAIDPLLGLPMSPELSRDIDRIALSYDDIVGIHDLLYHDYGPGRTMLSFHAEMPADRDLLELHEIVDSIERELKAKHGIDTVIHIDPRVFDPHTCEMRQRVEHLVADKLSPCHIHDFRIAVGPLHTKIIFDVVAPYGFHMTDNMIQETLTDEICSWSKDYICIIVIDHCHLDGV